MDISALSKLSTHSLGKLGPSTLTGALTQENDKAEGTLFEALFNSALNNINTTNNYISDMENEEIRFAIGETENTHDLLIATQKAATAIQYTVAIRDKVIEAYKEIMQIQI